MISDEFDMAMKRLAGGALFALAGALILSGPARAQALFCDVVVDSQAGGMVEVVSGAPVAGDLVSSGPRVTWRPAASSRAAQMMVALPDSVLTGTGEPTGLYIRFPIEAQEPPDTVTLNVRAANGRYWRFTGQGHEQGSEETAFVQFGLELSYGRALLSAIADGQLLTVSVEHYDKTVGSTTFGTASLRARDVLLATAKRKLDAGDPTMCKRR